MDECFCCTSGYKPKISECMTCRGNNTTVVERDTNYIIVKCLDCKVETTVVRMGKIIKEGSNNNQSY